MNRTRAEMMMTTVMTHEERDRLSCGEPRSHKARARGAQPSRRPTPGRRVGSFLEDPELAVPAFQRVQPTVRVEPEIQLDGVAELRQADAPACPQLTEPASSVHGQESRVCPEASPLISRLPQAALLVSLVLVLYLTVGAIVFMGSFAVMRGAQAALPFAVERLLQGEAR